MKLSLNLENIGRLPIAVKTPVIREGDDLIQIVIDSILKAVGEFHDGAIICITEAVAAIAQGNFVTPEDIQKAISEKYPGESEILLLFPIQSRNRFMNIPKAIAEMPQIDKIYVALTYPTDEVGNRLVSDEAISDVGINPYEDILTAKKFYEKFGKPCHPFTQKDYIHEFNAACCGKAKVVLGNSVHGILKKCGFCKNVLVCTIREDKRRLHKSEVEKIKAVTNVFDLSDILSEPSINSGYSPEYGLYGSNMMADGKLKLMPRACHTLVTDLKNRILEEYGKRVDVMIFGDGAFKDPVGGIWELADPNTTLAATSGLAGTPKEVKLKYIVSKYPDKNQEELLDILNNEKSKYKVNGESSLGTTPRRKTDLVASLADLATGSGDQQTPVVYILGYK